MKVHVDMNLCQSHGECVVVAPDMEAAVNACPMAAITIED